MTTLCTSQDPMVTIDRIAVDQLQSLIRLLLYSENAFSAGASNMQHGEEADLFRSFASARAEMATELQDLIRDPEDLTFETGTIARTSHRLWLDLRSVCSGQNTDAILAKAERSENYIKLEYERAMRLVWGDEIHSLLSLHFLTVQATRDRVRDLRDTLWTRR
jgi:uncharacterized protein (TIGR02284 family)